MLNKSKTNIAVVLIAIGIGLIPTGLIVSEYIRDQVGDNIPNVISHIHEDAVLEIEEQYLGLGIAEILPEIKKQETLDIKDEIVEVRFIPDTLLYLKNLSMPIFKERLNLSISASLISNSITAVYEDILAFINGRFSALIISDSLDQVINNNITTSDFAREQFFNNYSYRGYFKTFINGTKIAGISEFATDPKVSLNFTSTAQQRLLDGYLSNPGLIQDVENGTGVIDFMEFYENATIDPIAYNATMQNAYNSTWVQLTAVADYISDYLWNDVISKTWNRTRTPSKYADDKSLELFFNDENWSTDTENLTPIMGISEQQTGGMNNLSYTTTAQNRILYGTDSAPGLLENVFLGTGLKDYLELFAETSGDATMQNQYNATFYQLNNLTAYIIQYLQSIVVPAQLALEGLTLDTAALRDFYIQWANASIFSGGIGLNELSVEIGDLLKARTAATTIRGEINSLSGISNITLARDQFFNNYTFQDDFETSIQGVSEHFVTGNYSLNFTRIAQQRLLDGYGDAPGIFSNIDSGFGVLNWLDFYDSAVLNIGTNRTLMETTYNATWATQLELFGIYIRDYILGTIVTASAQKGLEAGVPSATDIKYATTISLWDPMNSNGIVNSTGIEKWYKAATGDQTIQDQLNATYNLESYQFNRLYSWIKTKAKNILTPIVFIIQQPLGIRLTTTEYAGILFLEQWANGTVIPSGMDLGKGLKGFEVGLPTRSNISYNAAIALFDTKNKSSISNNIGILKWINAYEGDTGAKNELIALFGLSSVQVDMTTTWLFTSLKENIIPVLLTNLTGYTTLVLAEFEFHRQWTNGTLFVNGFDLNPAFGLSIISGWELGIPVISEIDHRTSVDLWDEEDSHSLVNLKGNGLWSWTNRNQSVYIMLKDYFGLDDTQMEAILAWRIRMKEDFALPYMEDELNLPFNVYTYANTVNLGLMISGAIFLALGCVSIILVFLSKRR